MTTIIKNISSLDLDRIAHILKTVAHPVRLQIIGMLAKKSNLTVTDIYEQIGIEQSLASHHLVKMKENGILECRRDGKTMLYSLTDKKITKIIDCIENSNI